MSEPRFYQVGAGAGDHGLEFRMFGGDADHCRIERRQPGYRLRGRYWPIYPAHKRRTSATYRFFMFIALREYRWAFHAGYYDRKRWVSAGGRLYNVPEAK